MSILKRSIQFVALAAVAAMLLQVDQTSLRAQSGGAALTGSTTSAEEGAMEGVVVTVKKAGSTIAISVVSDEKGQYSFPGNRLEPGKYTVTARAVTYDLTNGTTVDVAAGKPAQLDLKFKKSADLSPVMSNGEWIMSWPGAELKENAAAVRSINGGCAGFCHTAERLVKSKYTAEQWPAVIQRMGAYVANSSPTRGQLFPPTSRNDYGKKPVDEPEMGGDGESVVTPATRAMSRFLASINLSARTSIDYPLKTLPRPKGKGTKVIIYEYDLPNKDQMEMPHDVIADTDGTVWYPDFGQQILGQMDIKTGKVTQWATPISYPELPKGAMQIEFDNDGNLWFGRMEQSGLGFFNKKTKEFKVYPVPKELWGGVTRNPMNATRNTHVDGKAWMNDGPVRGVRRVDIKTGKFETFQPYNNLKPGTPGHGESHSIYGIASDSQNNLYANDLGNRYIIKIDAKTGESTLYPTPTPASGPRRGHFDNQDRLWFAEFRANQLAMFDVKSLEFKEWPLPPMSYPYDAVYDKLGYVWTGGMSNDRVVRINTKTGETVEYLMPRATNIRRVDVDDTTNPPTFWVGNNHAGTIIKVEPLVD